MSDKLFINPQIPGSNAHRFSQVPSISVPRSRFDRTSGLKTAFDFGLLVPIYVDEVLPGDTFTLNPTLFARLATPLHPVMDNAYIDVHWFFVPNRLLWDNWERFQGSRTDPDDSTDYLIPICNAPGGGYAVSSLQDYMGLPILKSGFSHSALPLRAYNLIYNEWYRDQNLIDSLPVPTGDGPDAHTLYTLQRRAKRHDYFTSCLPWPQKGPAVELPLGGTAPVTVTNAWSPNQAPNDQGKIRIRADISGDPLTTANSGSLPSNQFDIELLGTADLSNATAATINAFRLAYQTQRLLELDARGGTRYVEALLARFGVRSPDFRLQRPEYLGGGTTAINITPVPATVADVAPQGNLAGVGTAFMTRGGFTQSFTEHGFIIGIASARADLTYQQGLHRMWSRRTRFDHYEPTLAHLGEQAVLQREIFVAGTSADDNVFGYQERWAEYRYRPSQLTSLMRSDAAQSLDTWHLAQDFNTAPVLNKAFVEEDPPVDRVIAVPSEPHLIVDCNFRLICARPMPVYSVPGLSDHL